MKSTLLLQGAVLTGLLSLTACAERRQEVGSFLAVPAGPTPQGVIIKVYRAPDMPRRYRVLGQVSGKSVPELQEQARLLGADAIVVSPDPDAVSGWVMANAIRVSK